MITQNIIDQRFDILIRMLDIPISHYEQARARYTSLPDAMAMQRWVRNVSVAS